MGEAAGALSDLVILTDDNPRKEDPLLIMNDVVVGLQKVNAKYRICLLYTSTRALEKDPNLRYQHASDMRSELQRLKRDTESGLSLIHI